MSSVPRPPADLFILIPTFDRYLALARITARRIDQLWPGHPPVLFCGLTQTDLNFLPLRSPPDNWIAVLRDACQDLRRAGGRLVYLILDDHPAMGACHARHLNHTLPALIRETKAVCLNLQGWDHSRRVEGKLENHRGFHLMRLTRNFTSKFGLHPALWDLDVLEEMCERFLNMSPAGRSPWDFERLSGDPETAIPEEWKTSSFRICGSEMELSPMPWAFRLLRRCWKGVLRSLHATSRWVTSEDGLESAERLGVNWQRFEDRRRELRRWIKQKYKRDLRWITETSHKKLRRKFEKILRVSDVLYRGPYPMFFSGVLRRGALNPYLVEHLEGAGETELLAELQSAVEPNSTSPPAESSRELILD